MKSLCLHMLYTLKYKYDYLFYLKISKTLIYFQNLQVKINFICFLELFLLFVILLGRLLRYLHILDQVLDNNYEV